MDVLSQRYCDELCEKNIYYYEYPIKTILVSSSKNITGSFRLLIKSEETQQITMFYLSVVSAALDSCMYYRCLYMSISLMALGFASVRYTIRNSQR